MLRRLLPGVLWVLWALGILLIVFPWRDLQNHTHWGKVLWIPFVSPPVKPSDVLGNILLYIPFGLLGGRALGPARVRTVAAGAVLLSLTTEASQLFSHYRYPSTTDFACNIAGCAIGLYLARGVAHWPANVRSAQEINS